MSLRRTLVLLQITLVTVGLVVFGVASYQLYRHAELQRLRTVLNRQVLPGLTVALCDQNGASSSCPAFIRGGPGGDRDDGRPDLPSTAAAVTPSSATCPGSGHDYAQFGGLTPGSFAILRSASGKVLARLSVPFTTGSTSTLHCPDPALPDRITDSYFTVQAKSGAGPFLVEARPADGALPGTMMSTATAGGSANAAGPTVLAGIPLNDLEESLHHLLIVDLVVGGCLLVALGAGSLLVIRRSLQPLERMATTSRAIAAGDLSRRINAGDSRSEIGQLGAALNVMLGGIERAFSERDATEQRLRQFLADASHELRTPLTSIRGYAELWRLQARDAAPAGSPGLQADVTMARIEEHARRMGELIEELLLLARLDDSHPPGRAPVDLVVLAAEACDEAAALQPGRPVSLDADEDIIVLGDVAHLRRAVTNLMNNALRHTPPDTGVEVHVERVDGVAQLVVRDHGPGMPANGLDHAFDRFWQADVSRATGGSGLGLAIVAGVAAEHGGAATVANADDGGAVLTLRLPLPHPDHPTASDLRPSDLGPPELGPPDLDPSDLDPSDLDPSDLDSSDLDPSDLDPSDHGRSDLGPPGPAAEGVSPR